MFFLYMALSAALTPPIIGPELAAGGIGFRLHRVVFCGESGRSGESEDGKGDKDIFLHNQFSLDLKDTR